MSSSGEILYHKGRGGGKVVSVLISYFNKGSSNPAEIYNFSVKLCLKRTKIYKKRPGLAHLKKYYIIRELLKIIKCEEKLFLKNGPNPASFCSIHNANLTINDKSIDGMAGT